jgi:O-antigen/teichoic acid export membrane protein
MSGKNASYRQIFKATSIFGGVQIVNILISILRSKVIAVVLGASGLGLVSIFTSTIGLVMGITSFGLGTSGVKSVAASSSDPNSESLAKTVGVIKYLVLITGILGSVITLALSPWLSLLAFGDKTYTVPFMFLSLSLFFTQVSAGQSVILQGMRKINYMAKASMLGATIGLLTSLPLYYFFGNDGIVPAILLSAISLFLVSKYFANKVRVPNTKISLDELKSEGKGILQMGFLFSISNLITLGAAYLVRIFISKSGGLVDVGLYTAGFAIISSYVGMVFTAMSTDYYPRLASVSQDNDKCSLAINQQAEIAILILAPILCFFLVFVQWGVMLLYSKEFLGIVNMIHWAALGIFFKALSWSIAFVFLAKSASKAYFWNELLANIFILLFNMIGYHFYGLTGLGISYMLAYFVYFIQIMIVSKMMYRFKLEKTVVVIFLVQFFLAVLCFAIVQYFNTFIASMVGSIFIVASIVYSYMELNKRLGITDMILVKFKKEVR